MKHKPIIKNEVLKALRSKDESVITLSGQWGCGKTHLWKEIESQLESPIYVSLFGCSDSGDLKRKIFTSYLNMNLRKKDVKDVINSAKNNGLGSIKEISKILLKGLDSYFGTNLLAFNTDVLNFVEPGVIFCIDDIERIGAALSIQEVFGVIDFLVNQKKCKVLLVLNEEVFKEDEGRKFQAQIEKVSRKKIKVEADVPSIFDTMTSVNKHQKWFEKNKDSILGVFMKSKTGNIRTMIRLIDMCTEILDDGISVSPDYAKTIAFYLIEQSLGQLKKVEDYNFSGGGLTLGWGDDGADAARREILAKYFNDFSDYKYSEEIYKYVDRSYFESDKLRNEIDPSQESLTEQEKFVRMIAGYDWYSISQEKALEFSAKIKDCLLRKIDSFTAQQAFVLIIYLEYLHSIQGSSILPEEKAEISQKLRDKGTNGDSTLDSNLRMYYSDFKKYWNDYYLSYSKGLERYQESLIVDGLVRSIQNEDFQAFVNLAYSNISKVHFLSDRDRKSVV